MINRVGRNQKDRYLKHLKNIFSGIEYDNLFITPVIPWVIDDPSFRYVKEFINSGLKQAVEGGCLNINSKKVGFIELRTVYEKPQKLLRECLSKSAKQRGDEVHYSPHFMNKLVDCAVNQV